MVGEEVGAVEATRRRLACMDLPHALILGIVEGMTEFLPISSTGHLLLLEHLLRIPASPFRASFTIAIQMGAILAVLILYGQLLLVNFRLLLRLFVAFVPTAISGTILYGVIRTLFLDATSIILTAMFLGGVVLLIFEYFILPQAPHEGEFSSPLATITYRQAIGIGLFQAFAMVPGVSRSAASIIGGIALGLQRKAAVEFSFLLAIPTMLAATSLDLVRTSAVFTQREWFLLALGVLASFLTALAAIRWFLRFLQCHTFVPFGIYRVLAAPVFTLLLTL